MKGFECDDRSGKVRQGESRGARSDRQAVILGFTPLAIRADSCAPAEQQAGEHQPDPEPKEGPGSHKSGNSGEGSVSAQGGPAGG